MSQSADAAARAERLDTDARTWLLRLRGESPPPREAFETWYVADHAHAAAYDALLDTWELSADLHRVAPIDVGSAEPRGRWRGVIAAMAAFFVVVVGIGVASLAGLGHSPADAFVLETKVGEVRTDNLPDGTRITLDTDSRVEGAFSSTRRQLRLVRGRARIAIAASPGRPLELDAANAVVHDGHVIDVSLNTGHIVIAMVDGTGSVLAGQIPVSLTAGQMVAVSEGGGAAVPRSLSDGDKSWPSGMLSFDDAPLSEVVAAANRYSALRIALADGDVAARRFTGTFRATDTVGLARMLTAAFHLTLSRDAAGNLLLSASPTK